VSLGSVFQRPDQGRLADPRRALDQQQAAARSRALDQLGDRGQFPLPLEELLPGRCPDRLDSPRDPNFPIGREG
jgi:hypothetical protein